MNYVQNSCLSIAIFVSFSNFGMGQQIIRDDSGFRVHEGQQEHCVRPCFVDPLLKRMNSEQLEKFVKQRNRIKAIKLSNGEYRLQAVIPFKTIMLPILPKNGNRVA
jgi:hypothetical protein